MITKILDSLYNGSASDIYSILNKSRHITDIENKKDALLFHTGFGFKSHKGTMFYLYCDLTTGLVVKSPESTNPLYGKIPQLLGLTSTLRGNNYIQDYSTTLFVAFSLPAPNSENEETELKGLKGIAAINTAEIFEPHNLKEKNKIVTLTSADHSVKWEHEYFEIINDDKIVNRFPLYKIFSDIVFVNGLSFSKYDPMLYTKEERQSVEEWYRSEFGDAANDAWWNTH